MVTVGDEEEGDDEEEDEEEEDDEEDEDDEDVGGKLSVSSNTLVKRSEQGAAVERVVSPAVQEIARLHYDCPSLAGAELESSLSIKNPTASHWEKRVLMTDYMTQKPDQVRHVCTARCTHRRDPTLASMRAR
eukprot:3114876-Rhodomonas_salina.3